MGRGYSFRVAAVAATTWLIVLGVQSENLHSLVESTSYDRLLLGLRLCFGDKAGVRPSFDPNFPLGSAVLYAIPCSVGLPSVAWGRCVSFVFALLAGWLAVRVMREVDDREGVAAALLVALVGVPALARGAVVVGEEAAYTAAVLGAVLGLMRGRLGWVVLAANAMVLVRLDAMSLVPAVAVGVVWVGGRRAWPWALGCCGGVVMHLLVGWRLGDGPLGFANMARGEIGRSVGGFGGELGIDSLPGVLVDQLGGPVGYLVVAAALWGLVALARRGHWVLALGTGYLLLVDWALSTLGVFEPRSPRLIAPLLALLVIAAVSAGGPRRLGATVVALLLVCSGLPRAWVDAREATLPPGLVEAAKAVGERPIEEYVVTNEQHPVVVVESGRPPYSVGLGDDPRASWVFDVSDAGVRVHDRRPK
jgi:hypothetical protein